MKQFCKITFWTSSSVIFLFQGLIPTLLFQSDEYIDEAIRLGYPTYTLTIIAIFRFFGAIALLLPIRSRLLHEWAYAGFTFLFILTSISYSVIDGFGLKCIEYIVYLVVLAISYISLLKIREVREAKKKHANHHDHHKK